MPPAFGWTGRDRPDEALNQCIHEIGLWQTHPDSSQPLSAFDPCQTACGSRPSALWPGCLDSTSHCRSCCQSGVFFCFVPGATDHPRSLDSRPAKTRLDLQRLCLVRILRLRTKLSSLYQRRTQYIFSLTVEKSSASSSKLPCFLDKSCGRRRLRTPRQPAWASTFTPSQLQVPISR